MPAPEYDAIVVGSGPNGLAAAITMARAGCKVLVLEAHDRVGGGTRTAELTLPGFRHDVCSAVHPLAVASPFFRSLPLERLGVRWIEPATQVAHPLDGGRAAVVDRDVAVTAESMGRDARRYYQQIAPLVADWPLVVDTVLGPLNVPRHPLALARLGLGALWPVATLARLMFRDDPAQAMLGGMAAHAMLPLTRAITGGFGLLLAMSAHAVGWPSPQGGSQAIADALCAYLRELGGEVVTGQRVARLADLPPSRAILCDTAPAALPALAGDRLPAGYLAQIGRYRYGPGVFKIDWALAEPIPWTAAGCRRAGTIHLGGTLPELVASEAAVWRGEHSPRPYVLLAQPSLADPTRAPAGRHTAWAYCHVPSGSTVDMTAAIEGQIERFAPGFRDLVLARHTMNAQEMEHYNPNYVHGDINCGVQDLGQFYTRPTLSLRPYRTPAAGLYLCSSATPPGGGVHGMCGYWAAQAALQNM